MKELVNVTGIVLKAAPVREYDKRIELLTREMGCISAFAQGARRLGSPYAAGTVPLTFGIYHLYPGRDAYHLASVDIQIYFDQIAQDYDMFCYSAYFAELVQYFTKENMESKAELSLYYLTLKAMLKKQMSLYLIRIIYEMKLMAIEGEALEFFQCISCGKTDSLYPISFGQGGLLCPDCQKKITASSGTSQPLKLEFLSQDALYTLQFIVATPVNQLFSFRVSQQVEEELKCFMKQYFSHFLKHDFKTENFLT